MRYSVVSKVIIAAKLRGANSPHTSFRPTPVGRNAWQCMVLRLHHVAAGPRLTPPLSRQYALSILQFFLAVIGSGDVGVLHVNSIERGSVSLTVDGLGERMSPIEDRVYIPYQSQLRLDDLQSYRS